MRTAFAIMSPMESVVAVYDTREDAELAISKAELFSGFYEIEEIDFNEEPLSEYGEGRLEVLKEMLKDTLNIHMDKGRSFYSMSADEKVDFMINLLDEVNGFPREKLDFNDSSRPVDLNI